MTHAKLVSETQIRRDAPRVATIDGVLVTGELQEPYLNSLGWYRLRETPAPTPAEGYHVERRYAYDDAGAPTAIVESWVEVQDPPAPPRTFSKYKMKLAIAQAGYLDEFTAMLASVEVAPGYNGAEAFRDALTLDEDHQKFKAAVKMAKDNLGLTDEDVERILAASVAE